ncbi:MAG: hypothetical protein QOE90_1365 [Thermoplasmata archaeon]|nr:hypothetical protein [Thermoplasmata archaeon]
MSARFRGECPKCEKVGEHEEFIRERRVAGSPMAAARGEFKPSMEYSFRCLSCGQRNEKIVDEQGLLHKWQGNKHVALKV